MSRVLYYVRNKLRKVSHFFTSMIVQKAGPVSTWCRSVVGGVVCMYM